MKPTTDTKIQKLYDDPKSRNFVNHLIHNYLPVYKATKVFIFEDNKKFHKCSVCGHELIDGGTVIGAMMTNEAYKADFIPTLMKQIKGEEIKREDHPVVKHITHGAILAYTGEKTTTYMCQGCIQELLNMVTNGLMMDDKNISYQINKMKRNTLFNSFTESAALDEKEVETVKEIQKKVEVNKKHVATLGDLNVLQQLKAKMEAEAGAKTL